MSLSKRVARGVGRRPGLIFGVTSVVTVLISVLALVVGKFEVSADNDGWSSRKTTVANRQVQYERLTGEGEGDNNDYNQCIPLRPDCWARAPAARRQLSSRLARRTGTGRRLDGMPGRRLDDSGDGGDHQNGADDGSHSWCDASSSSSDLAMVYRAKADEGASSNLLEPSVFQQVCEIEEQVLALSGYAAACRSPYGGGCKTVHNGACLAPQSAVTELREATPGGWGMTCAELVADRTILDSLVASLAACLASDPSCENARAVGFDFTADSPSTRTLSASFGIVEWQSIDFINDHAGELDLSTADVQTAYGQLDSEEWEDEKMDEHLMQDMVLVQASMAVSLAFLLLNTRSVFMSVVGLLQVGFSFPVAYFFYKLVFGFDFFPFLNFLGLFVIMGIGVDDLFVVIDKWSQAVRSLPPGSSEADIAAVVGPDAAFTMLLTSITTAAAFFATSVVPVAPIRCFAIFLGLMVLADYLLCLAMAFPAACLQHRWVTAARKSENRCVLAVLDVSSCCTKKGEAEAPPQPKLLDRFMNGPVHTAVRRARFVLLALFFAAIGVCAWKAADIPLPSSSEVQLLPDSHVIQRFKDWRKDLHGSSDGDSWVKVVWGLEPGDTGDIYDPSSQTNLLADRSFDPTSEDAQQWLLDFCNATAAAPLTGDATSASCALRDMSSWLTMRADFLDTPPNCGGATSLPVPPAAFHSCVAEYLNTPNGWNRKRDLVMYEGRLAVVLFHFQVTGIRWDSSYEELRDSVDEWEDWMTAQNAFAPTGVSSGLTGIRWDSSYEELRDSVDEWEDWMTAQNAFAPTGVSSGFFTSGDFHWWDTNRSMLEGAYISIMTALIVVSIVVFLATLNFLTTLYCTVAVAAVLLLVIGTVVGLGWELGFLEGICFAILIGLSCDFVLHMAHAYTSSGEITREAKSREAVARMGPPVFAAAVTTAATGAVMYGCTILFFLRFGTILVLTMLYAILTSVFFFLALTNTAGPTGRWFSLAHLCPRGANLAVHSSGAAADGLPAVKTMPV